MREPQRLVLVHRLEGRGTATAEQCGYSVDIEAQSRRIGGPVVVDLVIVHGHDPGKSCMGVAQRLLGFVLCVVQPVAGQIDGFVAVRSHRHSLAAAPPPALVDVVAQMDDQIEVFVAHVLVCGVEARTPRLTGGEREPHPRGGLPRSRDRVVD